ncbi:DUF6090 family protein [Robiginitalea sp. M366]|uniref:DUF6090 family protein n=1 Tax=Robiginitalea aestuariiviva TaxID=3036903 RepID=UPI00240DF03D|nr:DUF6090 family protein [Robiginitalea aestuariiviva]MDG1572492.1 DUF6090 family protein [Robiginitalea aestuariiviva]
MIKFFRKIRQRLLGENKIRKYLFYAIGEIILVVIGILIAIQLNDFNEDRKERKAELSFLQKLKDDIHADIQYLTLRDSVLEVYERRQEKGLELLLGATSVKDIITLDSLIQYRWQSFAVNRKTYDEMLNTRGIYIITNRDLLNNLSDHYALIEAYQQNFREINEDSREYFKASHLNPFDYIKRHYKDQSFDRALLDTTWISNHNSPAYLALSRFYSHVAEAVNGAQRAYVKEILTNSKALVAEIEQELRKNKIQY